MNKIKEGFNDFYSIEFNNFFPKSLITDEILPTFNDTQKDIIVDQLFYKNASDFKKVIKMSQRSVSIISTIIDEDEYENFQDLSNNFFFSKSLINSINHSQLILGIIDFSNRLEHLEIRIDSDTVEKLFKSLTLEKSSGIFNLF